MEIVLPARYRIRRKTNLDVFPTSVLLSKSEAIPTNITAGMGSASENIEKTQKVSENDNPESPATPLKRLLQCLNTPKITKNALFQT